MFGWLEYNISLGWLGLLETPSDTTLRSPILLDDKNSKKCSRYQHSQAAGAPKHYSILDSSYASRSIVSAGYGLISPYTAYSSSLTNRFFLPYFLEPKARRDGKYGEAIKGEERY